MSFCLHRAVFAAALVTAIASATPTAAWAEESIFDPENPDPPTQPEATGGSEETIFDPENPDADTLQSAPDTPAPPPPAHAPPPSAASARARVWSLLSTDLAFDRPGEDAYTWRHRADVSAKVALGPDTRLHLGARVDHWAGWAWRPHSGDLAGTWDDVDDARAFTLMRAREVYVATTLGPVMLTVGQQRVAWGSTDITRPADILNPIDLAAGLDPIVDLSGGAIPRAPSMMARAVWATPEWALEAVVLPWFDPHQFRLYTTDSAPLRPESPLHARWAPAHAAADLIPPTTLDTLDVALSGGLGRPDETAQNASVGARATARGAWGSASLGYLFGWDRTPTLALQPDLAALLTLASNDPLLRSDGNLDAFYARSPQAAALRDDAIAAAASGTPLLLTRWHRRHTLTLDASTYAGPVGVRADLALSPAQTFVRRDLTSTRAPSLHAALELTYEAPARGLLFITEGSWQHAFIDAPDSPQELPLGVQRHLPILALGARADLFLLVGDWTPVILQAGTLLNLRDGDRALTAQATLRLSGSARVHAALQHFAPPNASATNEPLNLGAIYDNNDQVTVGIEWDL